MKKTGFPDEKFIFLPGAPAASRETMAGTPPCGTRIPSIKATFDVEIPEREHTIEVNLRAGALFARKPSCETRFLAAGQENYLVFLAAE